MILFDKFKSGVKNAVGGILASNKYIQDNYVDPFFDWMTGQTDRDYNAEEAEKARAFEAAQADLAWQRNLSSAREAMEFESREAQINRDWQEIMDNTRYSRAMSDLKNAGINPLLAVSGGLTGSTPSGSTAHSSLAQAQHASGTSARAVSSGSASSILGILANTAIALMSKGKVKKK